MMNTDLYYSTSFPQHRGILPQTQAFLSFPTQISRYYIKEVTKASPHIMYIGTSISFLSLGYAQSSTHLVHYRSFEKPHRLLYY
jgi:hypothetical protein